jgi:hypothetical protein
MPVPARAVRFGSSIVSGHWWIWILPVAATIVITASIILVRYFPYSQKKIVQSLQETFPSAITIDHFQRVYFPYPGCKAEGIKLRSFYAPKGSLPIVTIRELAIQGNYANLLFRPHHISKIILDGLHIYFSPINNTHTFRGGSTHSPVTIEQLTANGAVMEVERADQKPVLRFEFHELGLDSISDKSGMSYNVAMRNPKPTAEIRSTGHFGPWNAGSSIQTPVSGKYSFDGGDLSVFNGIAGILNSEGTFSGPLGQISVQGTTDSPNFEVVRSAHSGLLRTQFRANVNGTDGDVALTNVDATYLRTKINAKGYIAKREDTAGKFTSLDFAVRGGRIEDILHLFVREDHPPMSGITSFQAHVTVPPDGKPFLKEVTLDGNFEIADGRFENQPRQESVDELSEKARGEKKTKSDEQENDLTENVISHVGGHAILRSGVTMFPELSFNVPGADARMHGTYDLLNERIDLHGTVKMDAKFSQSTSGIKTLFAKVLDPFLNKKHGSLVPVVVDGTYQNPHFGLDLNPVKK